ncbi:hypothetical protein H2201_004187 [Coniosporium apollinis]|uniref:Thioredoxin-like fold domain-containing protein n=1 Tax=Coniosporium apollinis TaxID=61459 RepID=A0ABQ9NVE7_9PEZI|nr:hypothetical protein H2201_004187 [Coniosporium apollinis]
MPDDDASRSEKEDGKREPVTARQIPGGLFTIPTPLKRLFNKFPLITYPANELPLRAQRPRHQHALYIFTTPAGEIAGSPSFNPSCLRWQAYLRFCGIQHRTVSSNNHASPSGALPFLLSSEASVESPSPPPVPSGKLQKWVLSHSSSATPEPSDPRYEAYISLLDYRIRRAWLYAFYLTSNFSSLALPLYINPTTSNPLVRHAQAHELHNAAAAELLKQAAVIDAETLYREAEEAFEALDALLGDNEWFFDADRPGLFDAAVFAYTHLLLDEELGEGWRERRLCDAVRQCSGLVKHQEQILEQYFSKES